MEKYLRKKETFGPCLGKFQRPDPLDLFCHMLKSMLCMLWLMASCSLLTFSGILQMPFQALHCDYMHLSLYYMSLLLLVYSKYSFINYLNFNKNIIFIKK